MKDKREAAPVLEHRDGQAETGTVCETASNSIPHDTTAAAGRQIQIKDFLLAGAENAVPRRHLLQLTGFSDRDLRRRIEQERRNGTAICSDSLSGYYIAANEAERRRFINSMLHRAAEIAKTAAAIEEAELD